MQNAEMKKSTAKKKQAKPRKVSEIPYPELVFRERTFKEAVRGLKHPKPIPGYKATLPGPPGWQVKIDPGP